jgi:cytochrome bd-type quinol oxidase subunit 2
MNNKIIKNFSISLIIFSLFFSVIFLKQVKANTASTTMQRLENVGTEEGPYTVADGTTFSKIAGSVVNVFLSLLGIIFIILIILAGYNWMTAGGNQEKIEKAKSQIKAAAIGLIIVLGAYAIWGFIFSKIIF